MTTVIVVAVADRHAGGLLAAVLQRVEAVEGEVGHLPARGVDAEDAAGFSRRVVGRQLVGPGPCFIVARRGR